MSSEKQAYEKTMVALRHFAAVHWLDSEDSANLQSNFDTVRTYVASLESQLSAKDVEIRQYESLITRMGGELAAKDADIARLRCVAGQLATEELREKDAEIASLKHCAEKFRDLHSTAAAERNQWQEKAIAKDAEIAELEFKLAREEAYSSDLKQQLAAARESYKNVARAAEIHFKEAAAFQQQLAAAKMELESERRTSASIGEALDAMTGDWKALKSRIEAAPQVWLLWNAKDVGARIFDVVTADEIRGEVPWLGTRHKGQLVHAVPVEEKP